MPSSVPALRPPSDQLPCLSPVSRFPFAGSQRRRLLLSELHGLTADCVLPLEMMLRGSVPREHPSAPLEAARNHRVRGAPAPMHRLRSPYRSWLFDKIHDMPGL